MKKPYCLLLTILLAISQVNSQKIETILSNFPANGYMNVDNDGNIYVSEYGTFIKTGGSGKRVYKISPEGKLLDSITNLSGPIGTVLDAKGNLYINNDNNMKRSTILKVDKKGNQTKFAEVKGWPIGIKKDKKGKMYLTNYNSPEIFTIDKEGNVGIFVSDKEFIGAAGIDFDSKGNLIVANFTTAKIFSISPNKQIKQIAELKEIVVQGWGIGYITVLEDTIYATGIAVSKLFKITLDGKVELFAGNGKPKQVDGNLKEASLNYPNGITSDKKNKIIYISEYGAKGGIRRIKL